MAITNAQQAKQLLALGGRTGFQGGGKDASSDDFGGGGNKDGNGGNKREQYGAVGQYKTGPEPEDKGGQTKFSKPPVVINPIEKLPTHFQNNQKLKNAVKLGLITNKEYNLLGGYDVNKTLGMGPVDAFLGSLAYNTVQSITGDQPFGDILGDATRTAKGAAGVTPGLQSTYESIMGMAEGGRIGYAIGGREKGDVGTTGPGKGDENGLEEKKERARQEDIRQRTLKDLVNQQVEDKKIEKLERFMKINSPTRRFTRLLNKVPGLRNINFNTRDYFADRFAPPGFENLSLSQQNKAFKDYMDARNTLDDDDDEGGIAQIPVDTTFAQAPVEEEEDYYGGRNPFDINRIAYRLMADGGAVMDDEPRQAYGLGSIVKKATRAVKKVAKSPIGKAALAYGLTFGIPGVSSGFFSKGLIGTEKFAALTGAQKAMLGITAASALAGLSTPKEEEEDEEDFRGEGLDIPLYRRNPQGFLAPRFMAEGGSTEKKEPVAKKVMPLINKDGK